MAMIGYGEFFNVLSTLFLCWFGSGIGLSFYVFHGACAYLLALTKILYHDPRPYMVDDRISMKSCAYDYGNPSGHALASVAFSTFIFLMYNYSNMSPINNQFRNLRFLITLVIALTFSGLLTFSRVYLGVHAIDQVLLGSLYGIWLALFYHFFFN